MASEPAVFGGAEMPVAGPAGRQQALAVAADNQAVGKLHVALHADAVCFHGPPVVGNGVSRASALQERRAGLAPKPVEGIGNRARPSGAEAPPAIESSHVRAYRCR